jgi:hypothetical protein
MLNWPQMPQHQMLSTSPTRKHAEILAAKSNRQLLEIQRKANLIGAVPEETQSA